MEFKCILNISPWTRLPISISISADPCSRAANYLAPSQNYLDGYQTNFSVCLHGALKSNFSSHSDLVQWLELNSILGAEHAYIYNYTGHVTLKPFIDYYLAKKFLTLLPYHLPLHLKGRDGIHRDFGIVWNYAQDVIIQDCLYRNLMVARRLALMDVDEFIIPRGPGMWTWGDMLENADCDNRTAVYLIRNVFFPTHLAPSGGNTDAEQPNLTVFSLNTRLSEINEPLARSKLIVVPDQVMFVGIHSPDASWRENAPNCVLDTNYGLLHHYRDPPSRISISQLTNDQLVKDETAYKYRSELTDRVKRVYDSVNKNN